MTDLRSIDILELLPQRPPFVMVGHLTKVDEKTAVTETLISADNIFTDASGRFSALGLIENIAQTCAAKIGYVNKYIYHRPIAIGFIGAIRSLTVYDLPEVGQSITTTITTLEEVFGMTLVDTETRCGDRIICKAGMKIALRNNEE